MEKRPFNTTDFTAFKVPGELQVSPDGKYVSYVVKRFDKKSDKAFTDIFMTDVTTRESRQLTFSGKDRSPVFSPDGKKLAFISSRNEKSQIWILPLDGGEAWCLKTKEAVSGPLLWTADGKKILYSAEVFSHNKETWTPYPGAPESDRERLIKIAEKIHEDKKKGEEDKTENLVKVITRFSYRFNPQGYFGDVRNQVFITPVPENPDIDWEPQGHQITSGDYGHNNPTISPNGKYIVVSSRRTESADLDKRVDLWLFEIDNGKCHLLYDAPGPCYRPLWSPCGKFIAFTGHDNRKDVSTTADLWIIDISGYLKDLETNGKPQPLDVGDTHNVTRPLDRPIGGEGSDIGLYGGHNMMWQGDQLIFLLGDRGAGLIYQVTPFESAKPVLVDRTLSVASLAVNAELIAYIGSGPMMPDEVYLHTGDSIQLTNLNKPLMDTIQIGIWEEFTYQSDDGQQVDGWLIYPDEFDTDKQYPLVLLIHGGPHGAYGPTFMFNAQLFAAQGYVVLYTNPRGSQTYGQDFACSIDKNWGDRDYADVMAGVDAVIQRGFIDSSRMFVHGWSYGGYLACWIATQTDRFTAICAGASVTNMLSDYGTSDITFADEWEYGGQPWKDYEHLIKHSAIGHVEKVKTPLMLMHGENDLRVPASQTDEFYIALKRLGKEVVMVRYPGEYHGLKRLMHKMDVYDRMIAWFNYYRDR